MRCPDTPIALNKMALCFAAGAIEKAVKLRRSIKHDMNVSIHLDLASLELRRRGLDRTMISEVTCGVRYIDTFYKRFPAPDFDKGMSSQDEEWVREYCRRIEVADVQPISGEAAKVRGIIERNPTSVIGWGFFVRLMNVESRLSRDSKALLAQRMVPALISEFERG